MWACIKCQVIYSLQYPTCPKCGNKVVFAKIVEHNERSLHRFTN